MVANSPAFKQALADALYNAGVPRSTPITVLDAQDDGSSVKEGEDAKERALKTPSMRNYDLVTFDSPSMVMGAVTFVSAQRENHLRAAIGSHGGRLRKTRRRFGRNT